MVWGSATLCVGVGAGCAPALDLVGHSGPSGTGSRIHPARTAAEPRRPRKSHTAGRKWPCVDRLQVRAKSPRLQTCQPTHSAFQCDGRRGDPGSRRPRGTPERGALTCRFEVACALMISPSSELPASASAAMRRDDRLRSRIRRSARLAQGPDVAPDPRAERRPCGPRPRRAMPPGRLRSLTSSAWSEIAGFGPRSFDGGIRTCYARRSPGSTTSVAMPQAGRRSSAGRRQDAVPGEGEHGDSSAATSAAPKLSERVSFLASSGSRCMVILSDSFMARARSACTGSRLRCLSEAPMPCRGFLTALLEPRRSEGPTGASEVARARHAKAAERLSKLRVRRGHRWPIASAALPAKRGARRRRGSRQAARKDNRPVCSRTFISEVSVRPGKRRLEVQIAKLRVIQGRVRLSHECAG